MKLLRSIVVAALASLGPFAISAVFGAEDVLHSSQIEALNKLIEERPDEFAGISIDEEQGKIVVRHSSGNDPYRMREMIGALPRVSRRMAREQSLSIELRPVARNHRQLEMVFQRLLQSEPWARLAKPVLTGWEIDVEKNVVAVSVKSITPELRQAATRTFGSAIELRVETNNNTQYSRSNDFAPWWGGIPIRGLIPFAVFANEIAECTAGFPVSEPGGAITGLLTAGHCFGKGNAITQKSDNEWVGAILERGNSNMGLDFALVGFGDGYGDRIWTSENTARLINNSSSPNGVAAFPVQVGTVVCFNGAKTKERCAGKITSLNSCKVVDAFTTTCGLVVTKATDGTKMAGVGDSGGPVYRKSGTLVLPEGIIIGGNGSAGTEVWYHPIGKVLKEIEKSPDIGGFGPWHVITMP